jgi:hypothetical protein
MRKKYPNGEYGYGIYEQYKGIDGKGPGWTEDAMEPYGDTLAELKSDYKYMGEAFKHPVLDYETGRPIQVK